MAPRLRVLVLKIRREPFPGMYAFLEVRFRVFGPRVQEFGLGRVWAAASLLHLLLARARVRVVLNWGAESPYLARAA